jgi:3-oxoacyl-[acyl-carrier-protein] synthase-3
MDAASGILRGIEISAMACAVPEHVVENDCFLERFGDGVAKFAKMTGVTSRHIAQAGQTASDLSCVAAKKVLDSNRVSREEIDALIFVSQTPDYVLPSTACVLHHRLGLKKTCLAFDINLGCSGFVYGLFVAASLCQQEGIRSVMLCGGDTITKLVSPQDRSAAMLFGDGGFAAVVSKQKTGSSIWHYLFGTDGQGFKSIIVPSGTQRNTSGNREVRECGEGIFRSDYDLYMDGTEVFNFTISEVPAAIKCLMGQAGRCSDNTDYLLLHQANLFILKQIAKMTSFPMDKVPVSMDRYGNTSVSSIPITLCDLLFRGTEKEELELVMAGFGVGLSWGVVSLNIRKEVCLPIAVTSECYTEGGLNV